MTAFCFLRNREERDSRWPWRPGMSARKAGATLNALSGKLRATPSHLVTSRSPEGAASGAPTGTDGTTRSAASCAAVASALCVGIL
jgi:hypothetical protein